MVNRAENSLGFDEAFEHVRARLRAEFEPDVYGRQPDSELTIFVAMQIAAAVLALAHAVRTGKGRL